MPVHVIYARKSTESDDRQVLSIDSQVQELKILALRRGLSVDEVLTEARSAKSPGRPVFGQLMKRVHRGEIASVLCWKMDRLARNHFDTGQVLQALADAQLPRVITPEREYTIDGNDRFLGNFEFGIATKFIDDLRANVRRGNRARFQRGWPNFRPPVGYIEDRATKTVIVDPERFPLVRRMWDELLSGRMRPMQIARAAEHEWGLRTRKTGRLGGKPLSFQGVYKLFANPFYAGLIRLKSGESYPGAFKPMITIDMFEQAQDLLRRPGRLRPVSHAFAYSGMLECDMCGGTLVPEAHVKPSGRRFVYYRCRSRIGGMPCANRSLPEPALEEQILADLRRLTLPPRAVAWISDNIRGHLEAILESHRAQREGLEQAIETAARENDELLTLKLRGQVDDETFERRRLQILDRQAKHRIQLEEPAPSPDELMERVRQVLDFSKSLPRAFEQGDAVRRRQILHAVCANPTVRDRKALYKAKEPFSFFEGQASARLWQAEDVHVPSRTPGACSARTSPAHCSGLVPGQLPWSRPMEQPFAYAKTERLWHLLLTLETLASFPLEARPTSLPALKPWLRWSYEAVLARAATAGLLLPVDVEAVRTTFSSWAEQSPLQREIVRAIVDDCDALQSDPIALDKAVALLTAWRQGHR